jgi:hypothetical protein
VGTLGAYLSIAIRADAKRGSKPMTSFSSTPTFRGELPILFFTHSEPWNLQLDPADPRTAVWVLAGKVLFRLNAVLYVKLTNDSQLPLNVEKLSLDIKCEDVTGWTALNRLDIPGGELVSAIFDRTHTSTIKYDDLTAALASQTIQSKQMISGLILAEYPTGFTCNSHNPSFRLILEEASGKRSTVTVRGGPDGSEDDRVDKWVHAFSENVPVDITGLPQERYQ